LLLHLPAPDLFLVSDVGFRWAYVQICWSIHGSKLYSRWSPSATADFSCSSICMVKLVADVCRSFFLMQTGVYLSCFCWCCLCPWSDLHISVVSGTCSSLCS
jgi:hypothetical protein